MRYRRLIPVVMGLCLLLVTACDDDTDTPPVAGDEVTTFIIGEVILRPYIDFLGGIHPIFGQGNEIDSILFGDSTCEIGKAPSYVEGNDYHYFFAYVNHADSSRYRSGDTATIRFYKGDEVATVSLKLLEISQDSVIYLSPAPASTFDLDEDVTVTWQKVENADWYGVYYTYDTSNVFGSEIRQMYDYTTDTTFTLPATNHDDDGEYRVFVTSLSGPVPGQAGNIVSPTITGALYGSAIPPFRSGLRIIMGSGIPAPPKSLSLPDEGDRLRYLRELTR